MLRTNRRYRLGILFSALVGLLPGLSQASDVLDRFFSHKTVQASFSQEVLDQQNRLQQKMEGQLKIERPGKFRWDYHSPYEQLIIADGKKVWMYDVDLEQVTIKAQDQTLGGTPAMLLSSRGANLEETFNIRTVDRKDKLKWYELTPKAEEAGFEKIYLGIKKQQLSRLEIADSFGQTTRIQFFDVVTDQPLAASAFKFKVPQGADVIDETITRQ